MSPGSSAAPNGKGTSQDSLMPECLVSKNRCGEEEVLDAQEMLEGPLGIPTSGREGTQIVLHRLWKEWA